MQSPTYQQLAVATLQLLQRVQISGAECDSFLAVRNWLTQMANAQDVPAPVDKEVTK